MNFLNLEYDLLNFCETQYQLLFIDNTNMHNIKL